MEKTLKQVVLDNIEYVFNASKGSKLDQPLFDQADKELSYLAEYFHASKSQALFIAIIFTLRFQGEKVTFNVLNEHLNCSPLKLLEYSDEFVELYERRLIRKNVRSKLSRKLKFRNAEEELFVNDIISEKILKSEPLPTVMIDSEKYDDIYTCLEKFYQLACRRSDFEISTHELFQQAEYMMRENMHLPLIEKCMCMPGYIDEKYLFLYIVWKYLEGEVDPSVHFAFDLMYDRPKYRLSEIQRVFQKKHSLIEYGWIEIQEATFFTEVTMQLTEKSFDLMAECGIDLYKKDASKSKKKDIITPDDIALRKLIYSKDEDRQIDVVKNLLQEENFKRTQERLQEKALPKGVTVLLYGLPGTGKTETVLQIAKATGREIMKVDISNSRSIWFGESEKVVKKIFKDYYDLIKKDTPTPILFFNEADAIISKRKQNINSNTGETENRIQNILLEELENFQGILVATTNLVANMDAAFERRFLFKVKFDMPSMDAKAQIWHSKMPSLSMKDCELLAAQFNFSGGQIDNIVRKCEINEIVFGSQAGINDIINFCKEESLTSHPKARSIGFRVHG